MKLFRELPLGLPPPSPPEISKDSKYIAVWKKLEIKRLQNHLKFESEIPKIVDLAERMARLEENWKELKTSEQTQDETLENLTDWVNQLMEDNERHKYNIAEALFSIAMLRSPGPYKGLITKALEDIKRDYSLVPKRDGLGFRSMRANEE